MTPLSPVVSGLRVSALDPGPPPPVRSAVCQRPGCGRNAAHRHHIVSRSVLNGPFNWVLITSEGGRFLVRNVADLCFQCHDLLESGPGGCKARLRFVDKGGWSWYNRADVIASTRAGIWWRDAQTNTVWEWRGSLKGEDWATKLLS